MFITETNALSNNPLLLYRPRRNPSKAEQRRTVAHSLVGLGVLTAPPHSNHRAPLSGCPTENRSSHTPQK